MVHEVQGEVNVVNMVAGRTLLSLVVTKMSWGNNHNLFGRDQRELN